MSHFLGLILVCTYTNCQQGQILISYTFLSGFTFPLTHVLDFLRWFAAFAYYAINGFISVPALPTLAILLCIINFCFDIIGSYGIHRCIQTSILILLNILLMFHQLYLLAFFMCLIE